LAPERTLRRAFGWASAVTLVLLAVLLFRAPYFGTAVRLWLVALAAIFIWTLSARALAGWPVADGSGPDPYWLSWRWWRRKPEAARVAGLEELEHAVEFSTATAFDVHFRLRPHLVLIAAHRLSRSGVDLESDPERASELLGAEAWELVRPGLPAPERRNERGLDLARVRRVVERLNAI
jgi:hypothetical protein